MKNILVIADPIDEPQHALDKAIHIAERSSSKLHLLAFCYEDLGLIQKPQRDEVQKSVEARCRQWWENHLATCQSQALISYEVIWEKDIHKWILEHCRTEPYDLIVKTGRRSESFFHTPTDWQLFRNAPAPVYSVNSKHTKTNGKVLVALDLLSTNEEKLALNKELMEAGFQQAMQTNSELHCCCAIEMPVALNDLDLINVEEAIAEAIPRAQDAAKPLLDLYQIEEDKLHVKDGVIWGVVTNIASDLKADCVVIGSMGHKGIASKLIGNTSEKVIQHVKSDLLVLSPKS